MNGLTVKQSELWSSFVIRHHKRRTEGPTQPKCRKASHLTITRRRTTSYQGEIKEATSISSEAQKICIRIRMNKEEICQRKVAIKPVLKLSEVMDVLYLIMLRIDRNLKRSWENQTYGQTDNNNKYLYIHREGRVMTTMI